MLPSVRTTPILLLGTLLVAIPSCKRPADAKADPEWWRLESQRVEFAHRLELLELRMAKTDARLAEVEKIREEAHEASALAASLETRTKKLRAELDGLTAELDQKRENWVQQVRAKAMGMRFDTLAGRGGRIYEDVWITRVSDIGIDFRHKSGSARLAAADLDAKQLELFGIDLREALEASEKERAAVLAYEASVDRAMAARKAIEEEAASARMLARTEARRTSEELRKAAADLAAATASNRSRLNEPPRRFRSSYYGGSVYYSGFRTGCSPTLYYRNSRSTTMWDLPPRASSCPPPRVVCPSPPGRIIAPFNTYNP